MIKRELELLVVKTIAKILEHIEWDGNDIVVGPEALQALREAIVVAHGEAKE